MGCVFQRLGCLGAAAAGDLHAWSGEPSPKIHGFWESSMEISWKFHGHFMEISWKFHGNFMDISWKFHGNVMEMSWKFNGNLWTSIGNFTDIDG